jgi:signal transduction histidine kinase
MTTSPPAAPAPPSAAQSVPSAAPAASPDGHDALRPRRIAGIASVLVSGLGSITWLWISVTVLVTGISMLPAALTGVLLLVPWVIVMRWAGRFERRRARAVHGIETVTPRRRVSTRTGFAGYMHTLGLDLVSWPFWRATLHHHLVMVVGFFPNLIFYAGIWTCYAAITGAVVDGAWDLGAITVATPLRVVLGVLALLVGIGALIGGMFAERGLARGMLPTTDDGLREEVQELTVRRQGAVDAADQERLRIERDLHDGVQPRLVALAMTLGLAKGKIRSDPDRAEQLVAEAHDESKAVITDLRQLARGIHPAVLTDRGLDAALSALAERSPIPVDLHVDLPGRAGRETEAVAYFVVSEALTNVAKHAGASRIRVDVRLVDQAPIGPDGVRHGALTLRVADDGRGGATVRRDGTATGLAGLTDRVRATGGRLELSSPPGGPTELTTTVPATVVPPNPAADAQEQNR